MNNYRQRIYAERDGHGIVVHDPRGREIYRGWEPGDRRWAQDVARDAIARDQAARREVAA